MKQQRLDALDPVSVLGCALLGIALGGTAGAAIVRIAALMAARTWRLA